MELSTAIAPVHLTSMSEQQLKSMAHDEHLSKQQKVSEMGRQFESALLKSFLEDALEPVFEGVLDESSSAHGIYRHFLTDALATSISQSQGFGFTSALQAQVLQQADPGAKAEQDTHSLTE